MSFLGGFSKSVLGNMQDARKRKLDMMDYETKLEKTNEINNKNEELLRKTRKGPPEFFEKDGQWYRQDVNLDSEPLGPPIPASKAQAMAEGNKKGDRELATKVSNANISQSEAATEYSRAGTAQMPEKLALERLQISQSGAYTGTMNAATRQRMQYETEDREGLKGIVARLKAGEKVSPEEISVVTGRSLPAPAVPKAVTSKEHSANLEAAPELIAKAETAIGDDVDKLEALEALKRGLEDKIGSPEEYNKLLDMIRGLMAGPTAPRNFSTIASDINSLGDPSVEQSALMKRLLEKRAEKQ